MKRLVGGLLALAALAPAGLANETLKEFEEGFRIPAADGDKTAEQEQERDAPKEIEDGFRIPAADGEKAGDARKK